ncbi:hypothetical protein LY78DRAFT_54950 [Colletotrichum sublineola]|nr:hypothetical protein LY78DRAFT_54950 [Colletotrichum sublineola]
MAQSVERWSHIQLYDPAHRSGYPKVASSSLARDILFCSQLFGPLHIQYIYIHTYIHTSLHASIQCIYLSFSFWLPLIQPHRNSQFRRIRACMPTGYIHSHLPIIRLLPRQDERTPSGEIIMTNQANASCQVRRAKISNILWVSIYMQRHANLACYHAVFFLECRHGLQPKLDDPESIPRLSVAFERCARLPSRGAQGCISVH